MKKLKIAFLWHQHQPYYRYKDEFILPWVRMHGVKDYFDLPEILHEFPAIRQTFNFAPSLYKQINQYLSGEFTDKIQRLTMIKATALNDDEKNEILEHFFKCQKDNMIDIHPRYKELYEQSRDRNYALTNFSPQEWLDLQIWYNLTWVGYFSAQTNHIQRLIKKDRNFNEEEKEILMEYHLEILKNIIPQMKKLEKLGQVEISVSPAYHPILPLLIDSEAAMESMPDAIMPEPVFRRKEDAERQIIDGIKSFEETFRFAPNGMWPSEGSVSDAALDMIAKNEIKWVATDEEILYKSKKVNHLEKYFPFKYRGKDSDLTVFFRDHYLSDKIGFEYSKWQPWDAANDFIHNLHNIRNEILKNYGDAGLDKAVVSVILDGENCWEFYKENGVPFLRELYRGISDDGLLETVKFSEVTDNDYNTLNHIHSGSWINADFNIWIGDREDLKAWELLGRAREHFEKNKSKLDNNTKNEIFEHIFAAEGSDWFWWYGPEHHTEDKDKFDKIFRWHLARIYELMNNEIPEDVKLPVHTGNIPGEIVFPKDTIKPEITGIAASSGWENAGVYFTESENTAMHKISKDISSIYFGTDYNYFYLRINTSSKLTEKDELLISFSGSSDVHINIGTNHSKIQNKSNRAIKNIQYKFNDCIDFAIELKSIGFFDNRKDKIELRLALISDNSIKHYPKDENLILKF